MKKIALSLIICLGGLFASPFQNIDDQNRLSIKTPALQARSSAKIRLKNGLEALLISDPSVDKSGAALSVEVGSWQDPEDFPGTAHFLEHMLFLGNKAYPEEDEFFKFVMDHGGMVNAYTAPDRTVYMFSINNDDIAPALNRFSHFFIDPLFKPSGIGRELHAVDQENDKNIENDFWRHWMILKETGNPNHPNALFSTGNAETLGHIPQNVLKTWYETHYNARNMHLVVYSNQSIDQLKKLAIDDFSSVTNNDLPTLPNVGPLTSKNQEGHKIYITPIRDMRKLELTFELPQEFSHDLDSKTAELLAYAINKEGEGSLISLLKKEEIAESLVAGSEQISKENRLFTISISLTKYGVLEIDKAIERVFELLAAFKEDGIPSYLFDEMKKMTEISYEYQSRQPAFDFVREAAHNLVDEPLSTYPQKTLIPTHFNKDKVSELLSLLTPKKAIYFILASPKLTQVKPDKKEKWLGGEYFVKKVDPVKLDEWSKISLNPNLYPPKPNPYIPDHLTLLKASNRAPELIKDNAYGKIYFAKDPRYRVPNSTFLLSFRSPLIDGSSQSTALLKLYIKSLKERLSSTLSDASDANLNVNFASQDMKFWIIVDGFSEKAPALTEEILKNCKRVAPTQDQFEIYKDMLLTEFKNNEKAMPFMQARAAMSNLLFNDEPKTTELVEATRQISFEDFLSFSDKLFLQSYVEGMLVGNLTQEAAELLWNHLRTTLTFSPYPKNEQHKKEILFLPEYTGPFMVFETTPMQGNALLLAIQEGDFSFESNASQLILEAALRQNFFRELRTNQQTAYIAKSWAINQESQLLQFFAVQSSTHNPLDLLSRFELFLETYSKDFSSQIPENRFEEIRSSLIEELVTPPTNLSQYALQMYQLAFKEKGDFDYIQKQIDALKQQSYKQLKADANRFFSRKNKRRLAFLLDGAPAEGKGFRYSDVSVDRLKELGTFISSKAED
ncbi:MAG: insulinase family protein [Simkaniaceae bacterium]